MTTQTEQTSVRMEIVVEAPIERAFRVFTEDFSRVKPPEHNMLGVEIAETVFEGFAGGRLFDRGVDGSEFQSPTMPQVRRGFERTIVSRVIVLCDLEGVFRVLMRLQLIERFVIAMRNSKAAGCRFTYE